jgi:hypothetical protein
MPPDPSTLEDGRLDELAAAHGMTIHKVRRTMGPRSSPARGLKSTLTRPGNPRGA